jgi:hypothetical protein
VHAGGANDFVFARTETVIAAGVRGCPVQTGQTGICNQFKRLSAAQDGAAVAYRLPAIPLDIYL